MANNSTKGLEMDKKKTVTFYLKTRVKEAANNMAQQDNRKIGNFIETLIMEEARKRGMDI
jgi:hypothetical protein